MNGPLLTPHFEGAAARQAHADIPEGTFERELGRDGFFGAATHMYHRNPPTAWTAISGSVRPRALDPGKALAASGGPWEALELFRSPSARLRVWRTAGRMDHLARNADGDDLLFVHRGQGQLFCDYGRMAYEPGDHLLLPRGTLWRLEPEAESEFFMVEATGAAYRLPERGMLGRHAPFDPGVLERPAIDAAFREQQGHGEWEVRVKRGQRLGSIRYPYNPLDAVGWKGDLYPVKVNLRDIRPVTSHRLHLPPSVRTSFVTERFVVCSLVPRPIETDPGALKLPFFHNNDDYDEVIYYHQGRLSSRSAAIGAGMLTFHPMGVTHGPAPATLPHMLQYPTPMADSYAVMVDSLDPLELAELPPGCEVEGYGESWKGSLDYAPDARAAAGAGPR